MANILVGIEHGVEVAAKDVLKFVTGKQITTTTVEPGVLAALGVLLGSFETVFTDVEVAVTEPLNLAVDVATLNDLLAVWPALTAFAASIGIKL